MHPLVEMIGSSGSTAVAASVRALVSELVAPGGDAWAAVIPLAEALYAVNSSQWADEDRCRSTPDDKKRGGIKRRVDRSNEKRTALINEIVRVSLEWPPSTSQDVPMNTEGLGSIIDRLTVLMIRQRHLRLRSAQADDAAGIARDDCDSQIAQLASAARFLMEEVAGGVRRLPRTTIVKCYAGGRPAGSAELD